MDRSKKHTVKKSEFMFFVSYTLFLMFMTLSASFYYKYFMSGMKLVLLGCCLICLAGEFENGRIDNDRLKGLVVCAVSFLLVISVSKGATENAVAAIFLFMYAARNVPFEKIAKFSFWLLSILLCFVIISSYVGIIDNVLFVKNGRARWYLGFRYALYAPSLYFNVVCLWAYLNQERKRIGKFFEAGLLLILNYWLYYMTKSRITFVMTCVALLIPFVIKERDAKKTQINRKWGLFIPCYIVCSSISTLMTVFYSGSVAWMKKLNEFLSHRLSLGKASILENGIGLFGKKITMVGNGMDAYGKISEDTFTNYTYVDSLYVQIQIHYGVIFTILYLVIMTVALYKSYKLNNRAAILIFALIGVHCMIDDMQLYLQYNTFWLLAGYLLMNKTKHTAIVRERRYLQKKLKRSFPKVKLKL